MALEKLWCKKIWNEVEVMAGNRARQKCHVKTLCHVMEHKWRQADIETFKDKCYSTALTTKNRPNFCSSRWWTCTAQITKVERNRAQNSAQRIGCLIRVAGTWPERRTQTRAHSNETRNNSTYRSKGKTSNWHLRSVDRQSNQMYTFRNANILKLKKKQMLF